MKDLNEEEFKMVSTKELKMQLTSKIDRLVAKNGVNAINKSKSKSYIEEPYPIGVKFNMYRELIDAEN